MANEDEEEEGGRMQLEKSLDSHPDDPSLHFNLGLLLWEKGGEESKAAEHFMISAKLNPQNGTAFRYLGDYYARISDDTQRALKCYQRAVILNPDDSLAGEPFCDLLDQQGKHTLQFSVCTEASFKSPRAFWAFQRLGFLLVHQKKWSEAVQNLQHAIRGYPTCADLWEALGLAYQRLGMFTAAIKSYGRAIELEESRIFAFIESGNVSLMLGSFRKGVEYFKRALEISPQNIAANYGLASSVLGLAKECIDSGAYRWGASLLEEASEVVVRIMSLAGNISSIWKLHGDIQLFYAKCFPWVEDAQGFEVDHRSFDYSIISWKRTCYLAAASAYRSYQRALHLLPWQANLYADIAVASDLVFLSKENYKEGVNSRSKSEKMCLGGLLLEGDNYGFWVMLGCLSDHSALRQHALIRGLQLDVSLAVAWAYLGKFYRQQDRRHLAQQSFDRARSIDPSLALPWAGMSADADVRNLKPDEAYECCLQSVQILPIAEFQIGLVKLALHSSALPSSAVFGAIRQALQRAPHYPESHNLNGLVCEARSDHKSASASFRLARHAVNSFSGKVSKSYLKDISINLARSLCKAGSPREAVHECELLKIEGLLDLEGLQIYALCLWQLGKNDMALSAVRTLAAGILSMEPRTAAASIIFINRMTYYISGQESAVISILKMPKELFQSSKVCSIIAAIYALDRSNKLESIVSHSCSLMMSEEVSSMHVLIALGKLVKHSFNDCLGIQNGVNHLRKALHMYPNSGLLRNLLSYLLLSSKEWEDVHLATRCYSIDLCGHQKESILNSAFEILGAGAVACYTMKSNDKFSFSSCRGQWLCGTRAIQQLQKCLHLEPWNYKARYLLILNYLQRARTERFPHHLCTILERLICVTLSDNLCKRQDDSYEYQRFQLLLCAAEVCLQLGDHTGCVRHAVRASEFLLPDGHLFFAHLLLCRAYASQDNFVNLRKEYMRCLELKTDCPVGWICLKIIDSQYKMQADCTILAVGFEECSRDVKNTWNMWMAVSHLVQGLVAIRTKDFLSAEDFLARACSLAGDESCLFLCHGIVCMELARQQCDSRFLSIAVRNLKKARETSRALPIVSLLLAQAEASLGSKLKWENMPSVANSPPYMALLLAVAALFLVCSSQVCCATLANSVSAESNGSYIRLGSNPTNGYTERHSEQYCAMYDICGERLDGKVLNCPYAIPAVKPDDLFSAKIQSLCPRLSGNVCCTETQFETLRQQVQQAIPFLVGCPACLRNFLNLFCELSCSPDQSLFINVTSTAEVNGQLTVDSIDYFISETFGQGLYNSCKDVKFGTMNTRAMDFIGAGALSFREWFDFIGQRAELGFPGSPYAMDFRLRIPDSSQMELMNASVYSCGDTSLGCSCGDCPSSLACADAEPPTPDRSHSCFLRIGSFKVKCIDFSLSILYIILILCLFGWSLFHQRRERSSDGSTVEPFLTYAADDEFNSAYVKKDKIKVPKMVSPMGGRIQLSTVQGHMALFFRRYGTWVARNPTLILFSSLVVVVIFCLGLVHFKVETRPEMLWVGPKSRAAEEKHFFDSHLAPFYRIEQLIISTVPDHENGKLPTIITEDNFQLLFEIQNKVDDLRANYSGSLVPLTDICLKPLDEDCATQSVLQYFKMDPDNFDSYGGVDHAEYCFQHYTSAETCLAAFKAPLDPSTVLGGFTENRYTEASAFIVTYPVNNAINEVGNENAKAVAWEKAFVQLAKDELLPLVQSYNLTLSFSSESSVEEELKRESTADVITILVSYLVMFVYISLTLGDASTFSKFYLSSKVMLGLSGVVLVMLSVLGSVGFFSAIGVKSTLIIMEVIPFLVLAVGVDNMCILVHAVKRQPFDSPLEERISNALVEVGPSITLASLSEVLAFAVGSFVPMPACRVFSMFAFLAVLLDFLLQITAFVALIVLDAQRAEDGRVDCFPCIKLASSHMQNEEVLGANYRNDGLLTSYMKEVHARILGLWVVKTFVVAIFVGFTLASIALCFRIEPGLEQQIALPRDSYLQDYFKDLAQHLRVGPPLYFVVKDYNYSLESRHTNQLCSISQCDSNSLLNEISRASMTPEVSYIAKPAASWLDDFLVWTSPEAFGCCRKFVNGSYCPPDDQPPCCLPDEGPCGLGGVCTDCTTCFRHSDLVKGRPSTAQFREKLPWFLNALPSADCAKGGHGAYTSSIDLNGYDSGVILASEFRTYHTPLNKQNDYVSAIRAARDFSARMSDSLKMNVFPYSVFYIFFEQYLDIWSTAVINIAVALGAVFIVCLVITSSLWSSVVIILVIAMIVLDLMGVMAVLNIQLNAVSVVNIIMSIGIAVEFCVHISHAFMVSEGDREQRARQALQTMGASVFSGITLTKLVGVIVLCFARSEIFVVYYFQMYLALVIIGFLHGLVFLPVILSIFGPPSRCTPSAKQEEGQTSSAPVLN